MLEYTAEQRQAHRFFAFAAFFFFLAAFFLATLARIFR